MRMTIDDAINVLYGIKADNLNLDDSYTKDKYDSLELAITLMENYEQRLKADMVAMLTELQLEIEEKEQYYQDKFLESKNAVHDAAMGGRMFGCGECKEFIQQKINSLKEQT